MPQQKHIKTTLRLAFLLLISINSHRTSQAQINEFNYHASERKLEYKWWGLISGPRLIFIYNHIGFVTDTIEFSEAISFHTGNDEFDHFVDYYVFDFSLALPDSGGIAVGIGPLLHIEQFISYHLDQPLYALDGPAAGHTSELIPKRIDEMDPVTLSLQSFFNNWYKGPQTYGITNHIGCIGADTTYIEVTLCPGESFDCGLVILVEDGQCVRPKVGTDECDSTIIYNVKFIPPTSSFNICTTGPCPLTGDYFSGQSILFSGEYVITPGNQVLMNAGLNTTLDAGFRVESGGVLEVRSNACW